MAPGQEVPWVPSGRMERKSPGARRQVGGRLVTADPEPVDRPDPSCYRTGQPLGSYTYHDYKIPRVLERVAQAIGW